MPDKLSIVIDGKAYRVSQGTTVAAAMHIAGVACRRSVTGDPRGPICGMGICFECRARVDGEAHVRTCQLECANGMEIETDA